MRKSKNPTIEVKPPGPGNQLTADQYIQHWKARRVWTHLERPKHLNRLLWCANQVVGLNPLDVGCAFGHSTAIMARFHPDAAWAGCDVAAEAAATARNMQAGTEIGFFWIPQIEDLASTGPWSTIIASEVIEHVQDDRAFLAGLVKAALNRVVLTTPAIDAQDPGHVRLYNDKSMAALLEGYDATWTKDKSFYSIIVEAGNGR
jgi:2-polyprenyl-3-methyl-5-hydroxy-6-metoxy-1,4-benzoquinol methylase